MIRTLNDIIGSMSDDVQEALTGDKKKVSHDADDAESCSVVDGSDETYGDCGPEMRLMGDIAPGYLSRHEGGDDVEEEPDSDVEEDDIDDDEIIDTEEEPLDDDCMQQPPFRTVGVLLPQTPLSWLADKFKRKPRDGRNVDDDDDFDF